MGKITDYSDIPELVAGDYLLGVDVSDTTDDPAGSTFAVPVSVLDAKYAALDEDDMASDSAALPASQQSVKAYTDSRRGGIYLTGATGSYISTPSITPTSDICIVAEIAPNDWTPSATQVIASEWNGAGNLRAFQFSLLTSGSLGFTWSADGAATVANVTSSTNLSALANKTRRFVAVTVDVDNGASGYEIRFWHSLDGIAWTQLGSTTTGGSTTSIFDGSAPVELGSYAGGVGSMFEGVISMFSMRSGVGASGVVGGTEIGLWRGEIAGGNRYQDKYGNAFTINGSDWSVAATDPFA